MFRGPRWSRCLALVWGCLSFAGLATSADFTTEFAAFQKADLQTPPPAHPVLFVGSSSIRRWTNLASAFPNWTTLNRGFGGSTMSNLLSAYEVVVAPYAPRILVVYEGDNDLAAGKSVAQVEADFTAFLTRVSHDWPTTPIVLLLVKPSPERASLLPQQRELNARLRTFPDRWPQVVVADTFHPLLNSEGQPDPRWFGADHLHLNAEGYGQWIPILEAALTKAASWRSNVSPP